MANIKSNAKRAITNNKKNVANAQFKSSVRTAIKKFNENPSQELFNLANKLIDKGVSKGVYNKSYASRKKSQLAKTLNKK